MRPADVEAFVRDFNAQLGYLTETDNTRSPHRTAFYISSNGVEEATARSADDVATCISHWVTGAHMPSRMSKCNLVAIMTDVGCDSESCTEGKGPMESSIIGKKLRGFEIDIR